VLKLPVMRNAINFGILGLTVVVILPGQVLAAVATVSSSLPSLAGPTATDARLDLAKAPVKKPKGKARKAEPEASEPPAVSAPAPVLPVVQEPAPAASSAIPANLPPPPALPPKYRAVAVLPVQGQDVPEEIVRGLEQSLLSEVDETEGMRAVSPQDIKTDLSNVGIDAALCQGQIACLAKAGRYARAHLTLDAKIAAIGGTLSVSMRLIDTEKATETGRVADPVSEDAKERAQEVHRMAVQLLAPETYIGSLTLQVSAAAAEVYLDDKLVGTTPLKGPLEGLRAGPHILRVAKPGFADVNQFVDVVYKRNATVSIDLANNTIGGLIVEVESKTGFGAMWLAANVPGVEIRIDGEPKGLTPLSGAIVKVAAGRRRVSFRGQKMAPQVQELEIKPNTRLDIAVTVNGDKIVLTKQIEATPDAPTPSYEDMVGVAPPTAVVVATTVAPASWAPGWRFYSGIVAGGLAVLGLGGGSYFGNRVSATTDEADHLRKEYEAKVTSLAGTTEFNRARDICRETAKDGTCTSGILADRDKTGRTAQRREFLAFGAGGVMAIAAVGLVLWDITSVPSTPAAQTNVTVMGLDWAPLSGGGGQLYLRGQF
jgi:hypothetical protein